MQRVLALATGMAFLTGVMVLGVGTLLAGEPAKPSAAEKAPWQRLLQGEDAKKAKELEEQIAKLTEAGQFEDAMKAAEELAELRGKLQGADHYEAVNARWNAECLRRTLQKGKEVQAEFAGAADLDREAHALMTKGRYKEEQTLRQRALAIRRKALGEDHPDTA